MFVPRQVPRLPGAQHLGGEPAPGGCRHPQHHGQVPGSRGQTARGGRHRAAGWTSGHAQCQSVSTSVKSTVSRTLQKRAPPTGWLGRPRSPNPTLLAGPQKSSWAFGRRFLLHIWVGAKGVRREICDRQLLDQYSLHRPAWTCYPQVYPGPEVGVCATTWMPHSAGYLQAPHMSARSARNKSPNHHETMINFMSPLCASGDSRKEKEFLSPSRL